MKLKAATIFLLALTALFGCTSEAYDSGDGKYSYLTAEFAVAHTAAAKTADYVVCDNGTKLFLSPSLTVEWAKKADTTYRILLYYNAPKASAASNTVEAVAATQVPVLRPIPVREVETFLEDPLTVESVWLAENGRYLNLSLLIKTGKADSDAQGQTVALVLDSIAAQSDGTRCAMTRLYHSQGGVPEYYTSRYYLSIDTNDFPADALAIEVNTYNGKLTKTISFSK